MAVLDKREIPVLALDSMNVVHDEEVELVNQLDEVLCAYRENRGSAEAVDQALGALVNHMREHFAGEESRMRAANFPAYMMHKSDHNCVIGEAQAVYEDWAARRDTELLHAYLYDTLREWFLRHVATMDTVTAQFLMACADAGPEREAG